VFPWNCCVRVRWWSRYLATLLYSCLFHGCCLATGQHAAIPSFIQIGLGIQKLMGGGFTDTETAWRPHKHTLGQAAWRPHKHTVGQAAWRPHKHTLGQAAWRPHKPTLGQAAWRPHKPNLGQAEWRPHKPMSIMSRPTQPPGGSFPRSNTDEQMKMAGYSRPRTVAVNMAWSSIFTATSLKQGQLCFSLLRMTPRGGTVVTTPAGSDRGFF
jgi:hypothetical protein